MVFQLTEEQFDQAQKIRDAIGYLQRVRWSICSVVIRFVVLYFLSLSPYVTLYIKEDIVHTTWTTKCVLVRDPHLTESQSASAQFGCFMCGFKLPALWYDPSLGCYNCCCCLLLSWKRSPTRQYDNHMREPGDYWIRCKHVLIHNVDSKCVVSSGRFSSASHIVSWYLKRTLCVQCSSLDCIWPYLVSICLNQLGNSRFLLLYYRRGVVKLKTSGWMQTVKN